MEPLSWTGALGAYLNLITTVVFIVFAIAIVLTVVQSALRVEQTVAVNADGTAVATGGTSLPAFITAAIMMTFAIFLANAAFGNPLSAIGGNIWTTLLATIVIGVGLTFFVSSVFPEGVGEKLLPFAAIALLALILIYVIVPFLLPYGSAGIVGEMSKRFLPVWIALAVTFALSIKFKRRLGLYGKLFDSTIGMIGFALVMFWVFTAFFVGVFDLIGTHDGLSQVSGLKNKGPGVPVPDDTAGAIPHYLLGGDNLARDIFSRVVEGSVFVILIAPLATVFAFMVGITLGLPAGFYGGRLDTVLSFIANLVLAFPVILLFYLLVTPEIVATGIPSYLAAVLFVFPVVFFWVLLNSRYHTQPAKRLPVMAVVIGALVWLYLSMINQKGTVINFLPEWFDLFDLDILVVFVSVVFVNSPTVFRIVRGLALDLRTRDYVAAAQTRGEGPWYVMLWEILPNARGPLIVDFCLRIGYTTILLGTLGFFGLGLSSESPDWGSTINEGRKLLLIYVHPAIPPAIALLTLVLGLNLLADGLREESLRD
ncbi:peptide/nickel transport system permease protein [Cognatiyoonia koreensis]|uniref:Peptide/nickel transport system permease protein n=1 Tax=Cognatiyoonia koreensis TaxID=364200 RepID=A0A1I0P0E3_9RHOB|nr:ABC transporter permease [Cognatiyoonia koreensis]SEW07725.1 peptide/nickel transport system permease protein [Cognatiyoonia koreensis]